MRFFRALFALTLLVHALAFKAAVKTSIPKAQLPLSNGVFASADSHSSSAPAMGLLHPAVVSRMHEIWREERSNPDVEGFFEDYRALGPMAAMAHMSEPNVAAELAQLMGAALGHNYRS
mmetsp:Transcript_5398/g.21371  ORF Transcript_5398/g.21371 Transcript_5398/m.21371 type:complete len:119 (-) Transcript_5398:301-657(-)|eukprot:scaffold7366_cov254-Pinguiococcus_pyrenoidosus.AAC.23